MTLERKMRWEKERKKGTSLNGRGGGEDVQEGRIHFVTGKRLQPVRTASGAKIARRLRRRISEGR